MTRFVLRAVAFLAFAVLMGAIGAASTVWLGNKVLRWLGIAP